MSNLLNIDKWMHPAHCLPDTWFRWMVIVCGTYVALMYFVFAYQVIVKLKEPLSRLIQSEFSGYLGWVFLFCAAVHWFHSLAYWHQYFKIPLLFAYPALCYYHTMLLRSSTTAIKNFSKLKTEADYKAAIADMNTVKLQLAQAEKTISNITIKKDFSLAIDYLKEYPPN